LAATASAPAWELGAAIAAGEAFNVASAGTLPCERETPAIRPTTIPITAPIEAFIPARLDCFFVVFIVASLTCLQEGAKVGPDLGRGLGAKNSLFSRSFQTAILGAALARPFLGREF
jgi:hypothetical protein